MPDIQEVISLSAQEKFINDVINDYRICCISREVSVLNRKLVLSGKGKFGISGDGKEVPQVAMARAFKKGDFRSGYYRDQTFMFALGLSTLEEYYAQLFADPDNDPFSFGRQMSSHFATPLVNQEDGSWRNHKNELNVSSDISPTGGQMARALGLALASKVYRNSESLQGENQFSDNGNEVSFCTIGDASTSEGVFWETINAAGVQKVPLAVSVWDDGFGISVPIEFQTTKGSISELLDGFNTNEKGEGVDIHTEYAWNYVGLIQMYEKGIAKVRETHTPAVFHIKQCTQPNGHSTSGSHERYKTKERLEWEIEYDCIDLMKKWMIEVGIATEEQLDEIRNEAKIQAKTSADAAWEKAIAKPKKKYEYLTELYKRLATSSSKGQEIQNAASDLRMLVNKSKQVYPMQNELIANARNVLRVLGTEQSEGKNELIEWLHAEVKQNREYYNTELYCEGENSALNVPIIPPSYDDDPTKMEGHKILKTFHDKSFEKHANLFAFGEDVGHIGGVNQGFAGLQEIHGKDRIFDTGIREWTIIGQGIGMAMRGLRPIAEIQYLDYLLYGLVPLSDDLATLRYRTKGMQKAPAIISTRGHRLEGIWHTGSPMGMMLHSLRGIYICVPRNMVQAAGMYNTLLQADDPAIVVECLNGYRLREDLPSNIGEYTIPLGVPDVLEDGNDLTLVTYGSCVRVAQKATKRLKESGISVELIDVQTLLPFDINHVIQQSLQKTNRLVILDEDVPGGASAFILQQIMEEQNGYHLLDSSPKTITAAPHRVPSGSDGDYFSKPNAEDVFEAVYGIMHEANPSQFPALWFS